MLKNTSQLYTDLQNVLKAVTVGIQNSTEIMPIQSLKE